MKEIFSFDKIKCSDNFKVILVSVGFLVIFLIAAAIENSTEKSDIHYNYSIDSSHTQSLSDTSFVYSNTGSDDMSCEIVFHYPIDINLATYEELCSVKGIGDSTSRKILNFRSSAGKITDLSQLCEIDGIGEKTVAILEQYFFVSAADYVPYKKDSDTDEPAETTMPETQAALPAYEEYVPPEVTEPEPENEYCYVHINYADAEEISRCLLISIDIAEEIVSVRDSIGTYSNAYEFLLTDSLKESDILKFEEYVIFD